MGASAGGEYGENWCKGSRDADGEQATAVEKASECSCVEVDAGEVGKVGWVGFEKWGGEEVPPEKGKGWWCGFLLRGSGGGE